MKKLLLLILLSVIYIHAHAQDDNNTVALSVGPELAFPARSVYNIGYGASLKVEIPLAEKFSLTATGGISSFHYKGAFTNTFGEQKTGRFIPLKIGTRYNIGPGVFFEAELGDVIETRNNLDKPNRNLFAFSLGPVFLIKLSDKQAVDLGVRYEQWSKNTLQQTAIRVAYRVKW
jgi:hypothetical protein